LKEWFIERRKEEDINFEILIDLGCGTGMVGREFSNFKPPSSSDNNDQNQSMNWIGIDVSKNVRYREKEIWLNNFN